MHSMQPKNCHVNVNMSMSLRYNAYITNFT